MKPRIAVIGSGPSGFFLGDVLSKRGDVGVDIFERLSHPYGLVRFGVAPDHPGTKEVSRVFDRAATRPNVRYFGGVDIGAALTLDDLREVYGAVAIATGADRGLMTPFEGSETRPDNVTAFNFMRAINGHPDTAELRFPRRVKSVAIVGAGNVALDVARILSGGPERLERWNPNPIFQNWFRQQEIEAVDILYRGKPEAVRYAPAMMDELVAVSNANSSPRFGIRFWTTPLNYRRGVLSVRSEQGTTDSLPVDLIIHAIGQRSAIIPGLPVSSVDGRVRHRDGWVDEMNDVFVLGWAAGDMSTTIADCRAAARRVGPEILARIQSDCRMHRGLKAAEIAKKIGRRPLSWGDWSATKNLGR